MFSLPRLPAAQVGLVAAQCSLLMCLAGPALAGPTDPVTLTPADDSLGQIHHPMTRLVAELAEDYIEEEFIVSGTADLYTYSSEVPVRGEVVPRFEDVPYTTRIIVVRPADPAAFSGTVVVEWWNSTSGFDVAPVWDPSAEFFARSGWIYVGFSNARDTIRFLQNGCAIIGVPIADCGTRYDALDLTFNGLSYDIGSQIATLLKSHEPHNPIPKEYEVKRLFHAGQSQQGGSMVTYASDFHFDVNDGYFVQAASGSRPINFFPACSPTSAPYPLCTPQVEGEDALVRTDLPVPVLRAMTETDVSSPGRVARRQSDAGLFRYYETAGAAHTTVHKDLVITDLIPPVEEFCAIEINSIADGPVFGSHALNALWQSMEDYYVLGTLLPKGSVIDTDDAGELLRDEFQNATGGIRLPSMDAPLATYGPSNTVDTSLPGFLQPLANLFCILSGTVVHFEPELVETLYPTHGAYVREVAKSVKAGLANRYLLPEDAELLVRDAIESPVGCPVDEGAGEGEMSAPLLSPGDIVYTDSQAIYRVDPETGERVELERPGNVASVAVSSGGEIFYASDKGVFGWDVCAGVSQLSDVTNVEDLAVDPSGALFYTDGKAVFALDTASGESSLLRTPGDTPTIAADGEGGILYSFKSRISGFDLEGNTIRIPGGGGMRSIRELAAGPAGLAYIDNRTLYRVDTRRGRRSAVLRVIGEDSIAMGSDGSLVYNTGATLRALDPEDRKSVVSEAGEFARVRDLAVMP